MLSPIPQFPKDPEAVLDFQWDWSAWLAPDETISDYAVTPDDGITAGEVSQEDGKVTAWLSGGLAGRFYTVACEISTSGGRTDVRRMLISICLR